MKIINKALRAICMALAIGVTSTQLVACGGVFPVGSKGRTMQGYTDEQVMLIIATERNQYRKVYTDQIWSVPVDEEGTTYQHYLLGEIKKFIQKMKTTGLLAQEKEITLTSQEKEQLQQLSEQYFLSLTQADKDYIGATQEDVYTMYEAYHLSNRVVEELTQDVNLEISDSEAKVMTVQEIKVEDENQARQIYSQVTEPDAKFLSIANTVEGNASAQVSVGRGERGKEYDDQVFDLEEEQITEPFLFDGQWYIVKCINPYDEGATLERKQRLAVQRKQQAFSQIYDAFEQEHPLEIQGKIWENVDFYAGTACTTTDFFVQYEEFMKQ